MCGYLTLPNGKFNIKKKFDKLIVPYLIVFALSIVPYYIIYKDLDILWIFPTMKTRSLFGIAGSFGIGPIWFLPCYFMSNYLVFTLSKKLSYKKILCVSISLFTASFVASKLAHGLPFLIYQTSIGALFIVLGYYCKQKDYLKEKWFVVLGAISTLLCFLFGNFSMYSVRCRLWIIQIIAGVFCTLLMFEISKKLGTNKVLEFISVNSLTILCIHSFDWSLGITKHIMSFLGIHNYFHCIFYCAFIALIMIAINLFNMVTKKRLSQFI